MAGPSAMGPGPEIDWELGVSTQLQRVLIIRAGKGDFKHCPALAGILGGLLPAVGSVRPVIFGSVGSDSAPRKTVSIGDKCMIHMDFVNWHNSWTLRNDMVHAFLRTADRWLPRHTEQKAAI